MRDGGQAVIQVSDDGIGIPLKAQARVFERFYRVDEGRSRDLGGSGLGLAIVKHVTDLYGGRVELQSEFGEGSTFTAYLPALSSDLVEGAPVR
jgi:two-component system, OmpR family, phosphate regulon sensor histidine kinase PhoR